MSIPIAWPEAQRICDIPEVREALDKFTADAHDENMLAMVSAIMGHASAQGRAAGLEEAAKDCKAHADIFAGDERELVRMVRGALLTEADRIRAFSPTSSDAGKDDARDAARYRWLREHGNNQSVIAGQSGLAPCMVPILTKPSTPPCPPWR